MEQEREKLILLNFVMCICYIKQKQYKNNEKLKLHRVVETWFSSLLFTVHVQLAPFMENLHVLTPY